MLIYTTFVTPFRISFVEDESLAWTIIDNIVDFFYFADVILNFFSAIYDHDDDLIIDRTIIAKNYLRGWFLVDIVSVLPLTNFFGKNYSALSRIFRVPRLYKLIKIAK